MGTEYVPWTPARALRGEARVGRSRAVLLCICRCRTRVSEHFGGSAAALPCRRLRGHEGAWPGGRRALRRGRAKEGEETMADSTNSLRQPRTRRSVARARPADGSVNVGDGERWLSLLGGGLLALYLLRHSLGTVVLLCGAGALLSRGLEGQCALYQAMGVSTVTHA